MRKIDIAGNKYERLTVIREADKSPAHHNHTVWLCQCECGKYKVVSGHSLRKKRTRSCGCLQIEKIIGNKYRQSHGKCSSKNRSGVWRSWKNMRNRCTNENAKDYSHYGGRGISVCERWQVFENFFKDMGDRPEGMSIDRVDTNRNYEPGNCRWATRSEQSQNKNPFKRLKQRKYINGKSIQDWADDLGVTTACLHQRLRNGWSVDRATSTGRGV